MSTPTTNVFLSFNLEHDLAFVTKVHDYLKRQPGVNVFLYDQHVHGDDFNAKIGKALKEATYFVFFHGANIGDYQSDEALRWFGLHANEPGSHRIIVDLPAATSWPDKLFRFFENVHRFQAPPTGPDGTLSEYDAAKCAAELARTITGKWIPYDGLPERYIFDYEKDIIAQFASPSGRPDDSYLRKGCPEKWPELRPLEIPIHRTPLLEAEIGSFRGPEDTVLVDIRSKYHQWRATGCAPGSGHSCLAEKGLTFLEAGPRKSLVHGLQDPLNVGILVTGGIAPGINAVIAGLVERHSLYWRKQMELAQNEKPKLVIHGYRDGFSGLLEGRCHRIEFLHFDADKPQFNPALAAVLNSANAGGSFLGTSRCDELSNHLELNKRNEALKNVLSRLWSDHIHILYVIGGDGSMKAAHALHVLNEAACHDPQNINPNIRPINIVGIPKTMDNDLLWVWQSFGFMSAVEKASECLRLLHTEAVSNPRLCVIQLFGSDSGFTVSHAALASLQCDTALIPERLFDMQSLFQHVRNRVRPRLQKEQSPYGMIIMAETAVPTDWYRFVRWQEHLQRIGQTPGELLARIKDPNAKEAIRTRLENPNADDFTPDLGRDEVEAMITFVGNDRRVYGQTPDALRTVSLRLVSQVLQHRIQNEMGMDPYWKSFRVFTNEPRHLLRSSPPSANDIISGRRFGTLAVDNAMAGYGDFMISQWLTEYVLVPLSLVVLGRKRVPSEGIFWKSVLAKTEQGELRTSASVPPAAQPAAA